MFLKFRSLRSKRKSSSEKTRSLQLAPSLNSSSGSNHQLVDLHSDSVDGLALSTLSSTPSGGFYLSSDSQLSSCKTTPEIDGHQPIFGFARSRSRNSSGRSNKSKKLRREAEQELDDVITMMTGMSPTTLSPLRNLSPGAYPLNHHLDEQLIEHLANHQQVTVKKRVEAIRQPWLKEDWSRKDAETYVLMELGYPGAFVVRKAQTRVEPDVNEHVVKERHVYSLTAMNGDLRVQHFQIFETECDPGNFDDRQGSSPPSRADRKQLTMVHFKNSLPHTDIGALIAYHLRNPVLAESGHFLLRPPIRCESLIFS